MVGSRQQCSCGFGWVSHKLEIDALVFCQHTELKNWWLRVAQQQQHKSFHRVEELIISNSKTGIKRYFLFEFKFLAISDSVEIWEMSYSDGSSKRTFIYVLFMSYSKFSDRHWISKLPSNIFLTYVVNYGLVSL